MQVIVHDSKWLRGETACKAPYLYNNETGLYDIIGKMILDAGYSASDLHHKRWPSQLMAVYGRNKTFQNGLRFLTTESQADTETTYELLRVNDDPTISDEERIVIIKKMLLEYGWVFSFKNASSKPEDTYTPPPVEAVNDSLRGLSGWGTQSGDRIARPRGHSVGTTTGRSTVAVSFQEAQRRRQRALDIEHARIAASAIPPGIVSSDDERAIARQRDYESIIERNRLYQAGRFRTATEPDTSYIPTHDEVLGGGSTTPTQQPDDTLNQEFNASWDDMLTVLNRTSTRRSARLQEGTTENGITSDQAGQTGTTS